MNFSKPKFFYFRDTNNEDSVDLHDTGLIHSGLPGTHSKDQTTCRACITMILCASQINDTIYVGIALRNPCDQFNRNTGRLISSGRSISRVERASRFTGIFSQESFDILIDDLREVEANGLPWEFGTVFQGHAQIQN